MLLLVLGFEQWFLVNIPGFQGPSVATYRCIEIAAILDSSLRTRIGFETPELSKFTFASDRFFDTFRHLHFLLRTIVTEPHIIVYPRKSLDWNGWMNCLFDVVLVTFWRGVYATSRQCITYNVTKRKTCIQLAQLNVRQKSARERAFIRQKNIAFTSKLCQQNTAKAEKQKKTRNEELSSPEGKTVCNVQLRQ